VAEKIRKTFCASEKEVKALIKRKENLLKKLKGVASFHDFFELSENEE